MNFINIKLYSVYDQLMNDCLVIHLERYVFDSINNDVIFLYIVFRVLSFIKATYKIYIYIHIILLFILYMKTIYFLYDDS